MEPVNARCHANTRPETSTHKRNGQVVNNWVQAGPMLVQCCNGCQRTNRATDRIGPIVGKDCRIPRKSSSSIKLGTTNKPNAKRSNAPLGAAGCQCTRPVKPAMTPINAKPPNAAMSEFSQPARFGQTVRPIRLMNTMLYRPRSSLRPAMLADRHPQARFVRPCRTRQSRDPVPGRCQCQSPA